MCSQWQGTQCLPQFVGGKCVDVSARLERQRPGDKLDIITLHVGYDHDAHLYKHRPTGRRVHEQVKLGWTQTVRGRAVCKCSTQLGVFVFLPVSCRGFLSRAVISCRLCGT